MQTTESQTLLASDSHNETEQYRLASRSENATKNTRRQIEDYWEERRLKSALTDIFEYDVAQ